MKGYTAYLIPEKERKKILSMFAPSFEKVILHHITHEFGVEESSPPDCKKANIIGFSKYVDEIGKGIEAFVVEVCGNLKRPDGKIYHITFSLSPEKYKPYFSNEIIKKYGFRKLEKPVEIKIEPVFIPF